VTLDDLPAERPFDWGRTSADYGRYRPGPPDSCYARLRAFGVGAPGQRIADLGTGTGLVARELARRGCAVSGVDLAAPQIATAREEAAREGLAIDFRVAPAEETGLPGNAFDAVTANQCWVYFDAPRAIAEVRRLLRPGGLLVQSTINWLPRVDPLAREVEALVLRHNPRWTGAGWDGEVPPIPDWARAPFRMTGMFCYDEGLPFTRETWRGRIRACRGTGASLTAGELERFDAEHAALLERMVPDRFEVVHRIFAYLLEPRR